jgi:GntR family transcriptional regulator
MKISPAQFQVHPSSGVPIYRQIMDQVKSLIAAGIVSDGDMLPSTRELAGDLEVNMMTVSKAYSKLEADGVVDRVRGRGMTVVATRPAASLADRKKKAAVMLEPAVLQAIHRGLTDEQIQSIVQRLLREQRS